MEHGKSAVAQEFLNLYKDSEQFLYLPSALTAETINLLDKYL